VTNSSTFDHALTLKSNDLILGKDTNLLADAGISIRFANCSQLMEV